MGCLLNGLMVSVMILSTASGGIYSQNTRVEVGGKSFPVSTVTPHASALIVRSNEKAAACAPRTCPSGNRYQCGYRGAAMDVRDV